MSSENDLTYTLTKGPLSTFYTSSSEILYYYPFDAGIGSHRHTIVGLGRQTGTMLSNFMRRNGKKKQAKHWRTCAGAHRFVRAPTSPESFESPQILDIGDQPIYSPREGTCGPFVQLELSTEPWFPEELLYSRRSSKGSACGTRSVRDAANMSGDPHEVIHPGKNRSPLPYLSRTMSLTFCGPVMQSPRLPATLQTRFQKTCI
ncbi:hypothetical protein EDD15DRAFT_1580443 [Pisolithus albus]|nr:hypothetical protein EDD15DRAFT_1580443 [Pisolithus albus]